MATKDWKKTTPVVGFASWENQKNNKVIILAYQEESSYREHGIHRHIESGWLFYVEGNKMRIEDDRLLSTKKKLIKYAKSYMKEN